VPNPSRSPPSAGSLSGYYFAGVGDPQDEVLTGRCGCFLLMSYVIKCRLVMRRRAESAMSRTCVRRSRNGRARRGESLTGCFEEDSANAFRVEIIRAAADSGVTVSDTRSPMTGKSGANAARSASARPVMLVAAAGDRHPNGREKIRAR